MKKILILIIILFIVLVSGCKSKEVGDSNAVGEEKVEIYVSAAASLTEAMTEIADLYSKESESGQVILNFGSSGSLQRQIEQGAPTDVFLSASLAKMKVLEEGDLLDNGYRNLLKNEIVLVIPNEDNLINSFDDLKIQKDFIFAMGEPESVPAGKYASEVLDFLELSDVLSGKTVLAKDVKEVLTWVELGEANAGMVYTTDAYASQKVSIAEEAPEGSHKDIIYPCAVVKSSENKEESERFTEFLYSEKALSVFEKYGFKRAE